MINCVHIILFVSLSYYYFVYKNDNSIVTSTAHTMIATWNVCVCVYVCISRIVDSDNRANFVYALWYQSICWHFWMHFFSLDKTKELLSVDSMIKLKTPFQLVLCYAFFYIHMRWNSLNNSAFFGSFFLFICSVLAAKMVSEMFSFNVCSPQAYTFFSVYFPWNANINKARRKWVFNQQKNDRRHHWFRNCSLERRFQITTCIKHHFRKPKQNAIKNSDARKLSKSISIVVYTRWRKRNKSGLVFLIHSSADHISTNDCLSAYAIQRSRMQNQT